MNKEDFLSKDRSIELSYLTGGSQPISYSVEFNIKDRDLFVTGKTQLFYSDKILYNNLKVTDEEIDSCFDIHYTCSTETDIFRRILFKYFSCTRDVETRAKKQK